jgi:AbrB family looped-hinge helix DNA binding protein
MTKHTTITEKGQITLPAEMRRALNLEAGEKINVSLQGERILISKPVDIKEVRRQLQEQMIQKGTEKQTVQNGDGWAAHIKEKHGG